MEQLPDELILMVLNKLDWLDDLFKCRLVCRRWSELVEIQTLQVGKHLSWVAKQMDLFSIDLNPVLFEPYRIDFMKSKLLKTTILSRLKQVYFCEVYTETEPAWISFEKSLQQLR